MMIRRSLRASLENLVVVGAVLAAVVGALPPLASAEVTAEEVAFDSEIALLERNDYGAYNHYFIRLKIESGDATLWVDKDGRKTTGAVSLDECQALWQRLLEAGMETLTDPPSEVLFPDQSEFIVQFLVAGQEGGFRAYGVDDLSDPRYREIVTAILAVGDSHLERSGEVEEP